MNEELIAEKLAELEPAWVGRANLFEKQIASKDVAMLTARLDDALPGVRADAAEALGVLKDRSATARLKAMLADPEGLVRHSAAVALVTMGDEALAQEFVSWREKCKPTIRSTYQILSRGTPNLENETWNASANVIKGTETPEDAGKRLQDGLASWYEPQK